MNSMNPFVHTMTLTVMARSILRRRLGSVTAWNSHVSKLTDCLQYYEALAKQASNNDHAIDLLTGCLDQVGLLEMRLLSNLSNGTMGL